MICCLYWRLIRSPCCLSWSSCTHCPLCLHDRKDVKETKCPWKNEYHPPSLMTFRLRSCCVQKWRLVAALVRLLSLTDRLFYWHCVSAFFCRVCTEALSYFIGLTSESHREAWNMLLMLLLTRTLRLPDDKARTHWRSTDRKTPAGRQVRKSRMKEEEQEGFN